MVEYINKADAIEILQQSGDAYGTFSVERSIYLTAKQKIKNIPVADVAPVKHGKWISDGSKYFCCNCGNYALWENERWRVMEGDLTGLYQVKSENCPYCGAKMDL